MLGGVNLKKSLFSASRKHIVRKTLHKYWTRILYWYVSSADGHANITFLNYGYSDNGRKIDLPADQEPNRYSIQLYHHIAKNVDFRNKALVEIGCGRGGGLFYLVKNWAPESAIGIDISRAAIRFCNRHFKEERLSFLHGNAQKLPLADNSCDLAINVESSHRYENFGKFLSEVHRVLRKDGVLLLADYRSRKKMDGLRRAINEASFKIAKEEIINRQVVSALKEAGDRKRQFVKIVAPWFLYTFGLDFADKIEAKLILSFTHKRKLYFNYILQKQSA
jgi:ubiquinone/menaquinone biosynthesis C-methylase UbiE